MSLELNNEFRKNPLAFFKSHSVVPPSDLGQKLTNMSTLFNEKQIGEFVTDTSTKHVTAAITNSDDIIRWIDFKPSTSLGEPGALTFSGSKTPVKGHVPIYFLPWKSMHLVNMSIPQLNESDYDNDEGNPNIFFTAAINGCSVFIKGTPTAPEVFHAGIDGTLALDAAKFWRECLAKAVIPGSGQTHEVNKAHYTKDTSFSGPARTPMAADYYRWLEDKHRDKYTISEVSPWGCVFGIRYGRLWSFYLQENATVTTIEFVKKKDLVDSSAMWPQLKKGAPANVTKVQQKKSFLGIKYNQTIYAAQRSVSHPMRVTDFYPGGPGRYSSEPLFRKIG